MKRIFAFTLAVLLLFGLAGCGEPPVMDMDMEKLSSELLNAAGYTDIMSQLNKSVAAVLYGIDEADIDDCVVYCGTGATAEEIAIFKAADSAAAERIEKAAEQRRIQQIAAYENYVPAEVPKLEKALIKADGSFIVYVVAGQSDAADKIVYNYVR